MQIVVWGVFLSGAFPLWRAWQGNRKTTLGQTLLWTAAAWACWGTVFLVAIFSGPAPDLSAGRYIALCLTGCAGVAVFGARRPGVTAWNFVLLGLLAVLLLPLAERVVVGDRSLDGLRLVFVAGTLLVTVLNYLPTRLATAALFLAAGCGHEVYLLVQPSGAGCGFSPGWPVIGLTPWVAFWSWQRQPVVITEFDRIWRDFRDRFGLVWAQRVREQFNRAAHHAGWLLDLRWRGLHLPSGAHGPGEVTQAEMVDTLRSILKRFEPASG